MRTRRRETFEVSMQRIGQRVLAIANFAEKRAGHSLDEVAR
jgi:hypothetical protein